MRNRRDELIAKLVRMGSDEGWYPDWEGPAAEPENYTYGDFGPAGEGARFGPGDHVVMMHGSQSGVVVGEPVNSFEGLAYYVDTYDQEGPRGIELWAESLLHRPDRYDQPGESTLEDWFGITPEGEDYYRTAARKQADYFADWLGPEADDQYWMEKGDWDGRTHMPQYLYRTMSEQHFLDSLKSGIHQSDGRMNWPGQAKLDNYEGWDPGSAVEEGTVAGRWAYPGYLFNARFGPNHEIDPEARGRIVKIQVDPEDEWEYHADADDEGGYYRTFKPIPTSRFVGWTPPMSAKDYMPSPYHGMPPGRRHAANDGMPGWDEILTPEFEQKRRDPAHAFIHFPDTGETTWTGPGGFHEQIENDFAMNGERMPENKLYGRYYPGRDEVYFDDARYYALPWEQQRALMEQVSKQAPR